MATTTPIDPKLDLFDAIDKLRKKLNAVILAHFYQEGEIQDVADHVGDSLALAQEAARTTKSVIVFAGVHFMAETAKILNPDKQVLLPSLDAGCSLADGCKPDEFRKFLGRHPDHVVISYINCSAEVKAMSDVICTSSNAVKIVQSIPADRKIVFAPDQHLGRYVIKQTGRDMVLWPGTCEVHETFSAKQIVQLKIRHPEAKVAAHPECTEAVLNLADHIGSTSSLLKFVAASPAAAFIVVTEPGIIHQMKKLAPDKIFIPGPSDSCSCNECPYMRENTPERLYLCMRDRTPEIEVPEEIRRRALIPIQRMLEISK
ncbi:MAG: quinolinate synthase NadA [Candidatus Eisenbacteria bacterium]|uniref:Quinolinate synthase n=1 Tax=Eiseniibacteriota bacterium TaxID=2212470 RepID=A0A948RSG4_UNCEI|nr:quinolinate synthase NadA [Candidatus Eisenbacteria bacterium]MBU1951016.1 quinolinate synthase NadA [Candidatus Eisenbacteria bacterium]MBU2690045.1 quinolinate synthase NadA [Candidatus Eisenbacteria bacterium]